MVLANSRSRSHSQRGFSSVVSINNSLFLCVPGKYFADGKRLRFSLSLTDTPANWGKAFAMKKLADADLLVGTFDRSLEKYRCHRDRDNLIQLTKPRSLSHLYKEFIEYKRRTDWAASTYSNSGLVTYKRLQALHNQNIDKPFEVREELVSIYQDRNDIIFRTLRDIGSCMNWLISEERATENKYSRLSKKFKPVKTGKNKLIETPDDEEEWDINPFTALERDLILEAFEDNRFAKRYKDWAYSQYLALVGFWFYTGLRTGEIAGLTWKDVKPNRLDIHQTRSWTNDGWVVKEGLKTQSRRSFPINDQLMEWLELARSKATDTKPEDYIFQNHKGNPIIMKSFTDMWTKCLAGLEIDYRRPYQCRHTFITLVVRVGKMPIEDVARICGTSEEIIKKHYLGRSESTLLVPSI